MKKILLIEDNNEMRENTSEILSLANYAVVTAENGKIGVEFAKKENPDLIICDIMMPDLDGYGVLHILSKDVQTAGIPFIFLTAKAEKSDMRKGMSMGADDYLTKPFDDTELLSAVEMRLKRNDFFKKNYTRDLSGLISFINEAKEFSLPDKISSEYKVRTYKKKDSIYHEGDTPNFVYFINKGKVKTWRINLDGKEFITGTYEKGDFFGHLPVLEGGNYNDSAAVMEECELAMMPQNDFLSLVYSEHEISARFIKMLANNINENEKRLLSLAYNSVKARTATVLLELLKKTKPGENIRTSREDLAGMVGTSTESLIRTLSDFKADKIIDIEGREIIVNDQKGLEKVVKFS
ncbi:MAG TPA: response regulator [Bacteroidia bacterium]|jgi:CheY-like chemotaxis protein/CRP-like cAMP-binding protein|nr:response regulator [Bacteroidia bacterium]